MSASDTSDARPTGERRRYRWFYASLASIAAAIWLCAPVAGYVVLASAEQTVELHLPTATWVAAERNDDPTTRPTSLAITWSKPPEVFAPGWSGLTEEVSFGVGSTLEHGSAVAIVGGITRIAMHTPRPFGRALVVEDRGEDVRQLNQLLRDRGLPSNDNDQFWGATLSGVRQLAAQIGVPDPDSTQSFDPAWFVYLPTATMHVVETSLQVGAPAPPAGDTIAVGSQTVSAAVLTQQTHGGEAPEEEPTSPGAPLTAAATETLWVGGQSVSMNSTLDGVDDAGLDILARLVEPGAASVRATLEQPPGQGDIAVPSAAILVSKEGRSCVIGGSNDDPRPIPVQVRGSDDGRTIVSGSITTADWVLIGAARRGFRCE